MRHFIELSSLLQCSPSLTCITTGCQLCNYLAHLEPWILAKTKKGKDFYECRLGLDSKTKIPGFFSEMFQRYTATVLQVGELASGGASRVRHKSCTQPTCTDSILPARYSAKRSVSIISTSMDLGIGVDPSRNMIACLAFLCMWRLLTCSRTLPNKTSGNAGIAVLTQISCTWFSQSFAACIVSLSHLAKPVCRLNIGQVLKLLFARAFLLGACRMVVGDRGACGAPRKREVRSICMKSFLITCLNMRSK